MSKQKNKPDYEQLNQKLLIALITLTSTFIIVAVGLYLILET
jgi:hypothetical protein